MNEIIYKKINTNTNTNRTINGRKLKTEHRSNEIQQNNNVIDVILLKYPQFYNLIYILY